MTIVNSTNALLDLIGVAQRADQFIFELVDANYGPIGDLNVAESNTPTINMDTSRTIFWTLSNVQLHGLNPTDINPLTDRIRVFMVLPDGSVFPLGVFVFGNVTKKAEYGQTLPGGNVWIPDLFDETFFVDQDLDTTVSIPVGSSIMQAYQNLIAAVGLPQVSLGDVPDQIASSNLTFQVGSSRYKALATMAAVLGSFPPHMTPDSTFTLQMPPPVGDTSVDHQYYSNTHIIRDSAAPSNDLYKLPNRWIAYGDSPTAPIIGIYDLPDTAPTSAVNRGGKRIVQSVSASGVATVEDAQNRARLAAFQDTTIYEKATFSSTADPRHGVFDTVSLHQVRYLEVAWSLPCKSGAPMTHSLIRLYD